MLEFLNGCFIIDASVFVITSIFILITFKVASDNGERAFLEDSAILQFFMNILKITLYVVVLLMIAYAVCGIISLLI